MAHISSSLASAGDSGQRLFHGCGKTHPGLEFITVDHHLLVPGVAMFDEPATRGSLLLTASKTSVNASVNSS